MSNDHEAGEEIFLLTDDGETLSQSEITRRNLILRELCSEFCEDQALQRSLSSGKYYRWAEGIGPDALFSHLVHVDAMGRQLQPGDFDASGEGVRPGTSSTATGTVPPMLRNLPDAQAQAIKALVRHSTHVEETPHKDDVGAPGVVNASSSASHSVYLHRWVTALTTEDIKGVLWQIGNISSRVHFSDVDQWTAGLHNVFERIREPIVSLVDLVHGRPTHWQIAGMKKEFSRAEPVHVEVKEVLVKSARARIDPGKMTAAATLTGAGGGGHAGGGHAGGD